MSVFAARILGEQLEGALQSAGEVPVGEVVLGQTSEDRQVAGSQALAFDDVLDVAPEGQVSAIQVQRPLVAVDRPWEIAR